MHYIISLAHTEEKEPYITLWRPNNSGYCYSKDMAGLYENPIPGYHNSIHNMSITEEKANQLFVMGEYNGKPAMMIPNTPATHRVLGLTQCLGRLVKCNIAQQL